MAVPAFGSPDYFDEALGNYYLAKSIVQILTEYGPTAERTSRTAIANDYKELLELTNPAIFKGGVLIASAGAIAQNDKVRIHLDGTEIFEKSFLELLNNGQIYDQGESVFLTCLNNIDFIYVISIKAGLDFSTQFKVEYKETYGNAPNIETVIMFAEVP